ncbi:MAG: 50S ribosomal protein L9 [Gammaproteobacteria bacterium]|nr:50S ribosomal protein L9 [Gammaproteobacteria bacterium]|tara:strand:- start:889 stop:1338 length:450 start_codon:yes stop_codon:yes gene_type:complete
MEVILLETIGKLGDLGEKVQVKSGYGRNYLIPQKKAVPATQENLEAFEKMRAELEKNEDEKLLQAKERAEKIGAIDLRIAAKVGEEGKLFGSVTVRDIAEAAVAEGIELERSEVRLPEGPIRNTGEFQVDIQLHPEVNAQIKLVVVGED